MAVSRRALIISGMAAGGGLGVWYLARRLDDGDAAVTFAASTPDAVALNAWVKIRPDGTLICGVHRAEMGQGVATALPMLVAEELDVVWEQVRFEFTPVDRDYFNFGVLLRGQPLGDTADRPVAHAAEQVIRGALHTLGMSMTISSTSIVDAWDTLPLAGATARSLLLAAAARRWGAPVERLRTAAGEVIDPSTGRRAGYGGLADAASRETAPAEVPRRSPAQFRLLGTSPPRLDIPAKVTGSAGFGLDTTLPGMLFAAVRHSPLIGTRLAAIDNLAEVSGMEGVAGVVPLGNRAVAVVARDTWAALRGAARLSLKPEPVDELVPDSEDIMGTWRTALDDPDPVVFREQGDAGAALQAADAVVESIYEQPYLAHVCMEPMNCTALVTGDGVTLWVPTQAESIARDVAAAAAGVASSRVTVNRTFLGGGFGRRAEMDFVSHAVGVAAAFPGTPVKLTYSREEDLRADMYRPATVARVRGMLGADGHLQALDYTLVSQSVTASYFARTPTPRGGNARKDEAALSGASNLPYAGIPNVRFAFVPRKCRVPVGFWRSTGNSQNCFVVECFMDEMAIAGGQDPVAFRLAHLQGMPRHQAVVREAAQRAGWETAMAAGRGRGVALIESHDSIVAQVIEVTAGTAGAIRVDRVVCVVDPGVVIHPDIVIAQMQGAIMDGLSAALLGRVTIRGGGVEQSNFDNYPLLRLVDTPLIEVFLLPQGGRPGGVGEPGLPGVAPALGNAIFNATGRRLRTLPFDLSGIA